MAPPVLEHHASQHAQVAQGRQARAGHQGHGSLQEPFRHQHHGDHRVTAQTVAGEEGITLRVDDHLRGDRSSMPGIACQQLARLSRADHQLDVRAAGTELGHERSRAIHASNQGNALRVEVGAQGRCDHAAIPWPPADRADPTTRSALGLHMRDVIEDLVGHGVVALAWIAHSRSDRGEEDHGL